MSRTGETILNGAFVVMSGQKIREAMQQIANRYAAGELALPKAVVLDSEDTLEIGAQHTGQPGGDVPHWHRTQRQYWFVAAGRARYKDSVSGEVREFSAGDFFAILPPRCFTEEHDPGTVLLYALHPLNDPARVCRNCDVAQCVSRREPFSGELE